MVGFGIMDALRERFAGAGGSESVSGGASEWKVNSYRSTPHVDGGDAGYYLVTYPINYIQVTPSNKVIFARTDKGDIKEKVEYYNMKNLFVLEDAAPYLIMVYSQSGYVTYKFKQGVYLQVSCNAKYTPTGTFRIATTYS